MDSFEQIGVNYQYAAPTLEQAQRSFTYSCKCCINKGRNKPCDRCAIEQVHNMVCAIFNDKVVTTPMHNTTEMNYKGK